jgi:hypothetical protein
MLTKMTVSTTLIVPPSEDLYLLSTSMAETQHPYLSYYENSFYTDWPCVSREIGIHFSVFSNKNAMNPINFSAAYNPAIRLNNY